MNRNPFYQMVMYTPAGTQTSRACTPPKQRNDIYLAEIKTRCVPNQASPSSRAIHISRPNRTRHGRSSPKPFSAKGEIGSRVSYA